MNRLRFACCAVALCAALCSSPLFAQTVCDEGNGRLDSAPPNGITPAEIIQKFAAQDTLFQAARDQYSYTVDLTIQTLNGGRIDGAYRQAWEIAVNEKGARTEKQSLAPQGALNGIRVSKDDLEDARQRLAFLLPARDLAQFSVTYVGQQRVDQLDTYVFDVSPKDAKKGAQMFQGRIWVDDRDLIIVKNCGTVRRNPNDAKNKTDVSPTFATYRQPVDQFWFPTYSRAEEDLRFPGGNVYVREVVKFLNYKRGAAK